MKVKKLLLLITVILGYLHASAQETTRIYLTNTGDRTQNQEIATSYAVMLHLTEDSVWSVQLYDMNNVILTSGYYRDEKMTVPHGKFIYYQKNVVPNDTIPISKIPQIYMTGYYVNGVKTGVWLKYFNGSKLSLSTYQNDMLNGLYQSYNTNTGKVVDEGYYINSKKDGDWCVLDSDSLATYTIVYKQGKVKKEFSYINEAVQREKEKEYEKNNKRAVPYFDFQTLIDRTFEHYSFAIAAGAFKMTCTITTEGKVINARVVQSFETEFDDLAIQAILHTRWKPATMNGLPINQVQNYTINIVDHKLALPGNAHKTYNLQKGTYQ